MQLGHVVFQAFELGKECFSRWKNEGWMVLLASRLETHKRNVIMCSKPVSYKSLLRKSLDKVLLSSSRTKGGEDELLKALSLTGDNTEKNKMCKLY